MNITDPQLHLTHRWTLAEIHSLETSGPMLPPRITILLRRCRRLVLIVGTIIGETLFLNLTLRKKPPEHQMRYRAERQSVACRRVLRIWNIEAPRLGSRPPAAASVIVSNHLGSVDGFAISSVFPVAISGKAELLRMPLIGWISRSIGLIPVYRHRRLLTAEFADEVTARLDAGVNVLVFPEGTTVRGTEVSPFKTGGFAAVEGNRNRAALPVTLVVARVNNRPPDAESHAAFTWVDPSQSLLSHFWNLLGIQSAQIDIVVGDRVSAADLTRKELAERCHEQISSVSREKGFAADTGERGKPALSGAS